MAVNEYLQSVKTRFNSGISSEHSYRADLEKLINELVPVVNVTNEPSNVTECGNPDYVITKGKILLGYIEAKDVGKDLNSKAYNDQFKRYKGALDNLIITDYIWFQFFEYGELVHEIRIAEIKENSIHPYPESFDELNNLLRNFCSFSGQTIKSPKKLAEMMAAKACLLENILERAATSDEETQENTSLQEQYHAFKQILIHDLKPKGFADIYAQTLAYGMFAARLHDPTLDDFSRQEAAELIPKTNPFLRRLFGYIAGPDIDDRIRSTVDNLADVFRATDLNSILRNFGKATQKEDPIMHFYETFLALYNPKLRKKRGVYYTPEAVVNFIVRGIDEILKTEFELNSGLADTSKTKVKVRTQSKDKRTLTGYKEVEQEVHKIQILDPATGTGTFLAEIVKYIYESNFKSIQGAWSGYVEDNLIPRLNGFELLMASYSMAHLKLDMLLSDTGFVTNRNQRFNIYLTNTLEEHHPDTGTLFAGWLSNEANEANHIKRDTPVMIVLGNPPYSVSSSNKGAWIESLMADYKNGLNERNINPLSDDYLKFIRYGQSLISKNGEGILAYITNNSYIDGLIHRKARESLIETFDKIYIIDLHGSAKRNEVGEDGGKDENVFDIQQGVAISFFIKSSANNSKSIVKVYDLRGTRQYKYNILNQESIYTIPFKRIHPKSPDYFFEEVDYQLKGEYDKLVSLKDLFIVSATGFKTERDSLTIQFDNEVLNTIIEDLNSLSIEDFRIKYNLKKDGRDWKVSNAMEDIRRNKYSIIPVTYRPFDDRKTIYTGKSKGFMAYPRAEVGYHLVNRDNYNLITCRQQSTFDFQHIFISTFPSDMCSVSLQTKETGYQFPLYLYPKSDDQVDISNIKKRSPNLNEEIIGLFVDRLGISFRHEKEVGTDTFAPIDILDYVYAVLHCYSYRKKYKDLLKKGFPRVPLPKTKKIFWQLVEFGEQLRDVHLLKSERLERSEMSYPIAGNNKVELLKFHDSKCWINNDQYFEGISDSIWSLYIGGYQPAQKWLKDRKGRKLQFEDILHYQKIISALIETERLMQEIDKIDID